MFESIRIGGAAVPEVLIVGHFQDEKIGEAIGKIDPFGMVAAARERGEATGEPGRIVEFFGDGGRPSRGAAGPARAGTPKGDRGAAAPPKAAPTKAAPPRVMVVGLGPREKFRAGNLRNIAAAVGRRLAQTRERSVRVDFGEALGKADPREAGVAFGEGLGLLGWVCDTFRGKATAAPKRTALRVHSADKRFGAGVERGLALAQSTNLARTLSETPPNIATPAWMAQQATRLARETGMSCRVFRGKSDLARERFEGLINVGKASENAPCMIRLEYRPNGGGSARRAAQKPVVLIGKTMCYDTGGLSLKINNSMVGMKRDKDGGCAVLGAMHAIATVVRPRVPVVALLAAAENSISDEAYRPDDVLRFRNGVTVEVTNTDAEGRLVLADALCYACDAEDPAYIVDVATLTGGVVTALGSTYAGLFCEDEALRARLERAGEASGERMWRLPLDREYREMMKSPVADILNSNPNRKAHPIQGAAFLSYFVEEKVPWAHIDIAGVHAVEGDAGPYVKGPTGWGVRLLANLVGG